MNQHDPVQFGLSDKDHYHGQSANWLHRLVPLLKSRCHEARILAAFHFVVEASIRKRQEKLQAGKTRCFLMFLIHVNTLMFLNVVSYYCNQICEVLRMKSCSRAKVKPTL